MREPTIPELSVVVPSVNGWADLQGCLAALEREGATTRLEILVPERCGPAVCDAIERDFPGVRILRVPPPTSIPAMRELAFTAATAPTVAVIEDHVLVPAGWARSILAARDRGHRVVGGSVANAATGRTVDWAAFFCEYSQLCVPRPEGPSEWLTGNNTAYDRSLLQERGELPGGVSWENTLHAALRARGVVLWYQPDIVVAHQKHFTVREYLSQRFLYARAYAGLRLDRTGLLGRLGFGVLTLGLPGVLFARIVSRVWSGGDHRAELLRSAPLLALFVCAWAAGELVGAWFGAGRALEQVK